MKVVVLGSGGREHALAYGLNQSPSVEKIFVAPGNGGTDVEFENVDLKIKPPHFKDLINFVKKENVDLVVVGPENYLVDGVVDVLTKAGIPTFGPNKQAALLEGSKQFAKKVMQENNIPTASYQVFFELEKAADYIKTLKPPYVLKADGLAAGKGVIIAMTEDEALKALKNYFIDKTFGEAGQTLIIESFLEGQEVSILAFTDGETVKLLSPSQDHKRAFDGDKGPNTGGMGVYAPVKILSPKHLEYIEDKILLPAIKGLAKRGITYKGILYAGLMVNGEEINVVEFNCRFGDPETQCVLPLLKSDLAKIMLACINGNLKNIDFEVEKKAGCSVVMASGGYPQSYQKGFKITGLDKIKKANVFHSGTLFEKGEMITHGGRVLTLTSYGENLPKAIETVYRETQKVDFKDHFYRQDIGKKGL